MSEQIYRKEFEKMRTAYSDLSSKVDALFEWLADYDEKAIIRRKMAELFGFAYMEGHFKDLRDKWPNASAREYAEKNLPTLVTDSTEKSK